MLISDKLNYERRTLHLIESTNQYITIIYKLTDSRIDETKMHTTEVNGQFHSNHWQIKYSQKNNKKSRVLEQKY